MQGFMFTEALVSIACAVISGVILYLFKRLTADHKTTFAKRVEADIADRELVLSIARALDVVLRKMDGENLNGDVKAAQEDLTAKRMAVQELTTKEYFETINRKG